MNFLTQINSKDDEFLKLAIQNIPNQMHNP